MPITFTVANLQELDRGKVALALNHAIRQCILDIEDRPGDKTARVVELKMMLTPTLERDSAALDTVGTQFKIQTKLPVRQSVVYPMLPSDQGTLLFEPNSPQDPRQMGLEYDAQRDRSAPSTQPEGGRGEDDGEDISEI